jgi:predicted Ser/Thr protein kinase
MEAVPTSPISDTDITRTQIINPRAIFAARVFWVICLLLNIAIIIGHTYYFYNGVREAIAYFPQPFLLDIANNADAWRAGLQQLGWSPEVPAIYLTIVLRLAEIFAITLSFIIFFYRFDNWTPLWLSVASLFASGGYAAFWVLSMLPYGATLTLAFTLTTQFLVLIVLFRMPDGRFVPKIVKWLLPAYFVWEVFRHVNQSGQSALFLAMPFIVWQSPFLLLRAAGVIAQIYRYRHGSVVYRHQLKWFVLGLVGQQVFYVVFIVRASAFDYAIQMWGGVGFVLVELVAAAFAFLSVTILVLCMGIAITRYRLYDVNIIINRSLVYGVVTAAMALVFVGGSLLLQALFGREQSGIAIVISVVAAAMLFSPARRRLQHIIDRRFYGFRFDLDEVERAQQPPEIKNPGALTGTSLGKYQILGLLGKGGMGEVYHGHGEGRHVAIKILPESLVYEPDSLRRFEREAATLAAFDHPKIVKLYESGKSNGVHYMALEYIEGRELSEIIRQRGAIPFEEVRPFIEDFAAALDYAHAKGLVHRDIKPSNIMIRLKADNETEEAVLMDFGVAKLKGVHTDITGFGAIGTIDYMAPEQIRASREVDRRADIYALGVVLYEMLTGERPFKGGTAQVLFAHIEQPVPDPLAVNEEIPAHVASAVMRALAKDPSERFQTVGELAAALLD